MTAFALDVPGREMNSSARGAMVFAGLLTAWMLPAMAVILKTYHANLHGILHVTRSYSLIPTMTQLAIIGALLAGGARLTAFSELPRWTKVAVAVWGAFLLCTTVTVAPFPFAAIVRSSQWVIHGVFALVLFDAARRIDDRTLRHVWQALMMAFAAYAAFLIAFVATIPEGIDIVWPRIMPGFSNVRHLGYIAAATAALSAVCVLAARDRTARLTPAIVFTLALAIICWSGSRAAIGGTVAALIATVLLTRFRADWRLWALLAALAGTGLLMSLVYQVPDRAFGFIRFGNGIGNSADLFSKRDVFWRDAWAAIRLEPLIGYGEGQMRHISELAGKNFLHPHQVVLQMWVAWGIIGGSALLALFARGYAAAASAARAAPEAAPAFAMASALLAMAMIDGTLFHAHPVMLTLFGLAVCVGYGKRATAP